MSSTGGETVAAVETPRVSIVIPVYNAEKYVTDCLTSIQKQTVSDFEVICVDDGSQDSSAETIAGIAEQDPRIRLVRQENSGASGARNKGYDLARGDYLTFVDADDELSEDFVDVLLTAIVRDDADVALGNTYIISKNGKRPKYPHQKRDALVRGVDHEQYKLLSRNAPHGKLFRRSFLLENGLRYLEGITYEDYHHWLECVAENPKISLCKEFVYLYKRNPYSISAGSKLIEPYNIESRLTQTKESIRVAKQSTVKGLKSKTIRMQFQARLMRHITALEKTKNREAAEKAFTQLKSGLQPLSGEIRGTLKGYRLLTYELILRGTLDDLLKLLRWGEGKDSLSVFVDSEPEAPKVYAAPEEFPSITGQPREFFDVSDKVRKK